MNAMIHESETIEAVRIPANGVELVADLTVPEEAVGVVLFAHGSGSSRRSERNRLVAEQLREGHLATLLIDLLTEEEAVIDEETAELRFDIRLLAGRLVAAADWLHAHLTTHHLPIGLFGSSTGAGAALVAATHRPELITSVVSRGGRPDLAESALSRVRAPTLLIVGSDDRLVATLNRHAMQLLECEKQLRIIHGATHLFEEPGALEQVACAAREWFVSHLTPALTA